MTPREVVALLTGFFSGSLLTSIIYMIVESGTK